MQVNPISNQTNFKGHYAQTENGASYYKTNNALKFGATWGTIGAVTNFVVGEQRLMSLVGLAMHSGIGAFIDYKRNKHAAEAADYIQQVGLKKALATRDDIELSDNNRPYYKTKEGGKYGAIIGAIVGGLAAFFPAAIMSIGVMSGLRGKDKFVAAGSGLLVCTVSAGVVALGGFLMGKIADYLTNRSARKHA